MGARREGFALVVVLVFGLLITVSVATLARRAVVDSMIVANRDRSAQAEALARGGLQLATALLLEDLGLEQAPEGPPLGETLQDVWSQAGTITHETADGATLRLTIRDAGARLNLNALFGDQGLPLDAWVVPFLEEVLARAIEHMPGRPEEKLYDVEELVANLLDYVDADEVGADGDLEADLRRDPPYTPANQRLLSVDELRQVAGFDAALVEGLRPYVTVYPYVGGRGINLNTAPPHVLSLVYFCDVQDICRLAEEDVVRDVLLTRQDENLLCASSQGECVSPEEIVQGAILPQPAHRSDVFVVQARADVQGITRTLEAVLDRGDPLAPALLAWRMH